MGVLTESDFKSIHTVGDILPDGTTVYGFQNKYNIEAYLPGADYYLSLHQIPSLNGVGFKNQNKLSYMPGEVSYLTTIITRCIYFSKIYVPVGTTSIDYKIFIENQSLNSKLIYTFSARLGQAPETEVPEDITHLPTSGFSLEQLNSVDCIGKSSVGAEYLYIAIDSGISQTEGKWLYVNISIDQAGLGDMEYEGSIDTEIYSQWFESAKWGTDGDPILEESINPIVKSLPYTYVPFSTYFPNNIKLFIPPGCTGISVIGALSGNNEIISVTRFNSFIEADYTDSVKNLSVVDFKTLQTLSITPVTLAECLNTDIYRAGVRNIGTPNVWDFSEDQENTDIATIPVDGGWLYISMYSKKGTIPGLSVQYTFNVNRYLQWYCNMPWDSITADPMVDIGKGSIVIDTPTIAFDNVELNTEEHKYVKITNKYSTSVNVTAVSHSDEITFLEAENIPIPLNGFVFLECVYFAKKIGRFSSSYSVELLKSSKKETGIITYECVEPSNPCLITSDTEVILFDTIDPKGVATSSIRLNSTYTSPCTIIITDIPFGVTVSPETIEINDVDAVTVEFSFSYESNKILDTTVYITSPEHSEVSIPIKLLGVCSNKTEELIISKSEIDFGIIRVGEISKQYLFLCSKYTEDISVALGIYSKGFDLSLGVGEEELFVNSINMSNNTTSLITIVYKPKRGGTNLDGYISEFPGMPPIPDSSLVLKWLDFEYSIRLKGSCPIFVLDGKPTFLMVNASDFRRAEINDNCSGTVAVINERDKGARATITYPEGFKGIEGPIDVENGVPYEITVTFKPTEYKKYTGNIKVTEIDK